MNFSLETFLAFKTPLDDRYKNDIQKGKNWTCKMLIQNVKDENVWLNLAFIGNNPVPFFFVYPEKSWSRDRFN